MLFLPFLSWMNFYPTAGHLRLARRGGAFRALPEQSGHHPQRPRRLGLLFREGDRHAPASARTDRPMRSFSAATDGSSPQGVRRNGSRGADRA